MTQIPHNQPQQRPTLKDVSDISENEINATEYRINTRSRDLLSVNTKIVRFWKMLLVGTEGAYSN